MTNSLIVTTKINDVDLQARLTATLARIAEHPSQRLGDLLSWNRVANKAKNAD